MSLNYNEPDTAAVVTENLEANPSISSVVLASISTVLDLSNPDTTVVVGSWTGTGGVVQPEGSETQMVVVDIDAPAGTDVDLVIPPENLASTSVWVFDTDANINVTFNTTERVIVMGNGNDEVVVLGDRNTTIDGGDGNDTLILSGGNDSIIGGAGNDSVVAGDGADTIVSGIGIDTVDGGLGFDVLQLEGTINDWSVVVEGDVVSLTGAPGSGNGVEMTNVNFISFGTSIVDNGDQFSIVVTDDALNKDDAMRLYQTALDRSADQGGAQYWLDTIDAGLNTYFDTATYFLQSAEFESKYGTLDNEQFVNQMYENAFDREAEQEGLDYWLSVLNDGASRAAVVAYIAGSAEAAATIGNVVVVTDIV
jgi:Ca2+-binding RTX toxin-like protein